MNNVNFDLKVNAKMQVLLSTKQIFVPVSFTLAVSDIQKLINGDLKFIKLKDLSYDFESDYRIDVLNKQISELDYINTNFIYGISFDRDKYNLLIRIYNLNKVLKDVEETKLIKEKISSKMLTDKLDDLIEEYHEVFEDINK